MMYLYSITKRFTFDKEETKKARKNRESKDENIIIVKSILLYKKLVIFNSTVALSDLYEGN